MNPALQAELAALYAGLERELQRLSPRCELSGRCCDFPASGHRLYATAPEIDYALALGGAPPRAPSDSLCPWHVDGMCRNRDGRPLGCRVYFCDPGYQDAMPAIYERHHAALRELHARHGLPYAYASFPQAVDGRLAQAAP